jgi:hypothetical protein
LVNNNASKNELEVMPAFWWMYNMYALERNAWKYKNRDKRKRKFQHIEFDAYAPDSMEEVILARKLLEMWTAKAYLKQQHQDFDNHDFKDLRGKGKKLLHGDKSVVDALEVFGEHMEKGKRKVRILKVYDAYHAYGKMLTYYAVRNVLKYLKENPSATFDTMTDYLKDKRQKGWSNLGGQLMMTCDLDQMRADIRSGLLNSWDAIHHRYDEIWEKYEKDKLRHAYLSLCYLHETDTISDEQWKTILKEAVEIQQFVCDQVYISRKKDYENIFRKATYRNEEEMLAALGPLEENDFIRQVKDETNVFDEEIKSLYTRF